MGFWLFDIFTQSFNLFTPIFMGLGAALGILIGFILSRPRKNQVWKILVGDNRGYDLDVLEENALSLHCEGIGTLPSQRFLKYRAGITTQVKRRLNRLMKVTRHIAREGTAYTQRIEAGIIKNIKLSDTLKVLWGEEGYNKMPTNLKEIVEISRMGVTVNLENDPLTPPGHSVFSEENIKIEQDRQASKTFWQERSAALKGVTVQNMAWIGFGFGICFVLCLMMGWIPLAKVG